MSAVDERVIHLTVAEALKLKDWAMIGNEAFANRWPYPHKQDPRPRSRFADDAADEVRRQVAAWVQAQGDHPVSQRTIDAILDDPRLSDLYEEDGTPVEPGNFVLRVGILFANGVVTAGEARALVAPYGSAASSLGHLPDEYRCHPRRPRHVR